MMCHFAWPHITKTKWCEEYVNEDQDSIKATRAAAVATELWVHVDGEGLTSARPEAGRLCCCVGHGGCSRSNHGLEDDSGGGRRGPGGE